jgi:hypothetical protein
MKLQPFYFSAVLSAGLILFAGCSSMHVQSDYDDAADFGSYRRYEWLPGFSPKVVDGRIDAGRLDTSVRRAVEERLTSRGYEKATTGAPDFFISYQTALSIDLAQTVDQIYQHRAEGDAFYAYGWESYDREYDVGSLIIDIIDARTEKIVWRGWAEAQVDFNSTQPQRDERIGKAVRLILERFPP